MHFWGDMTRTRTISLKKRRSVAKRPYPDGQRRTLRNAREVGGGSNGTWKILGQFGLFRVSWTVVMWRLHVVLGVCERVAWRVPSWAGHLKPSRRRTTPSLYPTLPTRLSCFVFSIFGVLDWVESTETAAGIYPWINAL